MKLKLPRRRWLLLLLIAFAGLASWLLWPKSVMRERYGRIQIGMTRAEVAEIMGVEQSPPMDRPRIWENFSSDHHLVSEPPLEAVQGVRIDHQGYWYDSSAESGIIEISVQYRDGKAVFKYMICRMTPLEIKLREWLNWLRGLVGNSHKLAGISEFKAGESKRYWVSKWVPGGQNSALGGAALGLVRASRCFIGQPAAGHSRVGTAAYAA
jgi:hypothetical protein